MIVRFVLAVVLAMMLAGCSLEQSSESSNDLLENAGDMLSQATATGPQWSDYIPTRDGRVCTYSSSQYDEEADYASNTVHTSEYTDVRDESDGTHYTVENTVETNTIGGSDDSETFIQTSTLEYVLADNGTLRSEPGLLTSESGPFTSEAGLFSFSKGMNMSVDEFIVFPSIDALRQGESNTSSLTATWHASDPEAQAAFEQYLEPAQSAMKLRVVYTVEGVPPKEITTPAGTFTDVVGVSLKYEDIEMLNANAVGRSELDEKMEFVTGPSWTVITWYARDTGIVQVETEDGMASGITPTKLEGCEG